MRIPRWLHVKVSKGISMWLHVEVSKGISN